MISHTETLLQPPSSNTPATVTQPPETWTLRGWQHQASRLYRIPEAQRLALLEHIRILQHHTPSPARWLWLQTLGEAVNQEVRHG